jgi:hypothetical protein
MIVRIAPPIIKKEDWTISPLEIDGRAIGYVCEDEIREQKVHGETAIWPGMYRLTSRHSPAMSHEYLYDKATFELMGRKQYNALGGEKNPELIRFRPNHPMIEISGIPGFQHVMFHWGNTDKESLGCPLVGARIGVVNGRDAVVQSRLFYTEKFYPMVMRQIMAGRDVWCKVDRG